MILFENNIYTVLNLSLCIYKYFSTKYKINYEKMYSAI